MASGVVLGAGWLGTRIADYMGYALEDLRSKKSQALGYNVFHQSDLIEFLDREKPNVVVNAIGETNLDWCETHKPEAVLSNINVPSMIGIECNRRRILMVQLGAGCMYNGDNGGYGFKEIDEPNFYGKQVYADTKADVEEMLNYYLPETVLQLRIHLPLDSISHERNLVDKLKKCQKVINSHYNSVTTIPHALPVMKYLINKGCRGIFNLVNPGIISAADIMSMYKKIVEPSHTFGIMLDEEFRKINTAPRSSCKLNMDNLKMELTGSSLWIPDVHDAVRECLIKYREKLGGRK